MGAMAPPTKFGEFTEGALRPQDVPSPLWRTDCAAVGGAGSTPFGDLEGALAVT